MPPMRVLLADRDHAILCRVFWMLEQHGFDLLPFATDGRSLIDIAERLHPDVIVTDVLLWGMDGIEAVAILRQTGCKAKVVLTANYRNEAFAARCKATGVGYVRRSRLQSDLLQAIHEAAGEQSTVPNGNTLMLAA